MVDLDPSEFAVREANAESPKPIQAAPEDAVNLRLTDLAALALAAIEELMAGAGDEVAISRVFNTVFGRVDAGEDIGTASDPLCGLAIEAARRIEAVHEILAAEKTTAP